MSTLLLLSCLSASSATPSQAPPGFWDHWGDGRAELASYDLVQPRYGQARSGTAVLVTVTETLTRGQGVKSDGGHDDEFPAIKLNSTRDFQTGVYDYNGMTTSWVPLDASAQVGTPFRVTHTMQEWCGHVFVDERVDAGTMRWESVSYFDGEGRQEGTEKLPAEALFADAMPVVVRDLAGPLIAAGSTRTVQWRIARRDARMGHRDPGWVSAELSRSADTVEVTVPAGTFVGRETAVVVDGKRSVWTVEEAAPHRLLRWELANGETGALRGSTRMAYWQKSRNGDEAELELLGLTPSTWSLRRPQTP